MCYYSQDSQTLTVLNVIVLRQLTCCRLGLLSEILHFTHDDQNALLHWHQERREGRLLARSSVLSWADPEALLENLKFDYFESLKKLAETSMQNK